MAKNLRWTAKQMQDKGLVSNSEGDYVLVSSLVQKGKVPKIDPNYAFMKPTHVPDPPNVKYPLTIGECFKTDLFGEVRIVSIQPSPPLDPLSGEYILWVRTLTGKAKDSAKVTLKQAAEQMMAAADTECFYISGNVASSKNSKEIGRFKKRNERGELEEFSTLVDSKVTRAYRDATHGQWLQNKVAFKNAVQGLKLPISIEFTFIRDSLRRVDHHNTIQIIADMMVEYGWLPDDDTVHLHPVFNKTCFYHKQLAGVLLKIIK